MRAYDHRVCLFRIRTKSAAPDSHLYAIPSRACWLSSIPGLFLQGFEPSLEETIKQLKEEEVKAPGSFKFLDRLEQKLRQRAVEE